MIDSGSDLNAYAQVEDQALCCPPPTVQLAPALTEAACCSPTTEPSGLPIAEMACCTPPAGSPDRSSGDGSCCSAPAPPGREHAVADAGCCSVGPAAVVDEALHARLADLLRRYDVNDYASSVKVYAVKPR